MNLAIGFKEGISIENFDLRHLLVPAMVMCISPFLEPLTAFKVLTIILGVLLIYGTFKFSYLETKDIIFAYVSSLLILFNFGIVFLLTSLEDNIWMYPFVVLAIYYLFQDKMKISAIFMSLAILIHLQAAVFLIMFILYIYLKHRELLRINEGYINVRKIITAFLCLLIPLSLSYGALALLRGLSIPELISILTTSDYRSNPDWWYFSSDRNIIEQIKLVYFGLTSTFV
ncbi:MAG: hypothetical protein RMI01_10135, partial [Thermodesulfovibrio sp.]|nr:hypothetical protein [Thermodesulfovibrio sp.]